jgi:chloramphenicol-sensitive protein RarD
VGQPPQEIRPALPGQDPDLHPHTRGLAFGMSAYVAWGLFPLYWPLLQPASSLEVLAHRIIWSLVFVSLLLCIRPRPGWWSRLRAHPSGVAYLAVAGLIISANWGTYIWAVNHGQIVQTALGYYINPLVTVLVGVLVLRERLNRAQWVAVGIATIAVVLLTVDYGRPPWVSFTLALTFTAYAFCKKKAGVRAIEGLLVETTVALPLALGYVAFLELTGQAAFGHTGWGKGLLIAGAGVVSGIPLLLFAAAATRISLTTLGILQYVAPTLQFLLGVLAFHEDMPPKRLAGFGIVWLALAIFTWDGLRRTRRLRSAARAAPGSAPSSQRTARASGPG